MFTEREKINKSLTLRMMKVEGSSLESSLKSLLEKQSLYANDASKRPLRDDKQVLFVFSRKVYKIRLKRLKAFSVRSGGKFVFNKTLSSSCWLGKD